MNDTSRLRLVVLRVLVVSLLLTLFGRAWYLQVLSGEQYARAATDQGTRTSVSPAVRGLIVDAQGRPLVTTVSALVVTVLRRELPAGKDASYAVLSRLGALIGKPANRLKASIRPCGPDPDHPKQNVPPPCSIDEPFQPVPVATLTDGDPAALKTAQVISENPQLFPGIAVERRGIRHFDQAGAQAGTRLAAQTLGYVGPINGDDLKRHTDYDPRSTIGRGGVEQFYDAALRGTPGRKTVRVDARGEELAVLGDTPPQQGNDLVLNLDATIQKAAEEALQRAMLQYAPQSESASHPRTAAAVVMTTDGRVVALASAPSYDPSVFFPAISDADYARLQDPANNLPLNNKAVDGTYAPGSSFKAISSSTLLAQGIVQPGEGLTCLPTLPVGDKVFQNFRESGGGTGDLRAMLEFSCDTIFDKYAYNQWQADGGLRASTGDSAPKPREVFTAMAKSYGYGAAPGIDLPGGGTAGAVVDRATRLAQYKAPTGPQSKAYNCKRQTQVPPDTQEYKLAHETCLSGNLLQGGEAAQFAIGQNGVEASPLQMARAYAAVANGGTLYQPTLAKAVVRSDGTLVRSITPVRTGTVPVPPAELDYIRQGLYRVTHGPKGTAANVFAGVKFPVEIAGKTGTAEKQVLDKSGNFAFANDTAWFVSFGPYTPDAGTSAKFVVAVVVPDSGQGGQIAAPAARDIWSAIYGVQGSVVTNPRAAAPSRLPCFSTATVLPRRPDCRRAPAAVHGIPAARPSTAPSPSPPPAGQPGQPPGAQPGQPAGAQPGQPPGAQPGQPPGAAGHALAAPLAFALAPVVPGVEPDRRGRTR